MQSGANPPVYVFGGYRLDPSKRELASADGPITLTPHVFDCLTYLIEHRQRAIGRDELIAAVWGLADITDTLLAQTIMHARRAVGDSGRDQTSIRTIPRFGYRWVREPLVVLDDAQSNLPTVASETTRQSDEAAPPIAEGQIHARPSADAEFLSFPGATPHAGKSRRSVTIGIAVALIMLIAGYALWGTPRSIPSTRNSAAIEDRAALATLDANLVLVLPVDIDEALQQAWVPLGIMDLIASRVRDGGWPVVPSATAIAVNEQTRSAPIPNAANLSGAALVVQPRLVREDSQWRIELALRGRNDLPARIEAQSGELIAAAQLSSDRLLALLQKKPLPELAASDPDLAIAQVVQQLRAAFLTGQLEQAANLLARIPQELREHPELQIHTAELAYRAGRLDEAQQAYAGLLQQLGKEGDAVMRARCLIGLGSISRTRVDFGSAERYYVQAIAALENHRQPLLSGTAQAYLGVSLASLGRFDESADALAIARITLDMTGDALGVAMVDSAFATMAADRRQLAEAAPRMAKAVDKLEQLGAHADARGFRIALAQMYRELLEHEKAVATAAKVWEQVREQPQQRLYYMAAAQYAWSLLESGQLKLAEQVLFEASSVLEPADRGFQWRQMTIAQAQLDLWRGREDSAFRRLDSVFSNADAIIDEPGPGWLLWLRQLRAKGDPRLAGALAQMQQWAQRGGAEERIYLQLAHAEAAWQEKRAVDARTAFEDALQSAEQLGVPALVACAAIPFGHALLDEGYLQRAGAVTGRLSPWATSNFESAALGARMRRALQRSATPAAEIDQLAALAGERPLPEWMRLAPK